MIKLVNVNKYFGKQHVFLLANVAVIELMARTKQILSAANRYNGTNAINVSDVFVLFGVAALVYFVINFSLSMVVRSMQKKDRAVGLHIGEKLLSRWRSGYEMKSLCEENIMKDGRKAVM